VHITAVSGLHVSIVAGILLSLGVWLFGRRRPTYFVLALIGVWLYAVLTGWRPPVFRAAIMGSLWLFAAYIGRPRSALTSLLLAAAIMVGIHPLLLWSASFQLSFAGVAGLVFLMPKFQDLGRKAFTTTREGSGWGASSARFAIDTLSVTLAAILFTLPLIAYYFGYISVVGLPTSFFIFPAVPSIIVASALTGIIGLFLLPLAQILGWVAWLFSAYVIGVVELFSALPFAACNISVNIAMIVAYYLVLALAIWLSGNWKKLKRPLPEWKST
jgi:competence protein ComEC